MGTKNVPKGEGRQTENQLLQWHPAFYAGIQIEFGEEAEYLEFKQEYPLGTKPKQINVLIKKEKDRILQKNIGRIFRTHNIIEYKGPGDYLSIDDFYKVCGYTYFYKAHSRKVNAIKFEELTISLVSERAPRELMRHLKEDRGFELKLIENGIYYVIGDALPIQIIVTRSLSEKENLWLRSLTDRLEKTEEAELLLREYRKNKNDIRYESVMDIIVRANTEKFEEAKEMCKALEELMKDELEAKRQEGEVIGEERGKEIGEKIGKEIGEKLGEQRGKEQGEKRVNALVLQLSKLGRLDDVVKAAGDKAYQEKLFQEFGL